MYSMNAATNRAASLGRGFDIKYEQAVPTGCMLKSKGVV